MPKTDVVIFAEEDGSSPLIDWLDSLSPKVQDKCIVRVERLAEMGHELRRPEGDYLRDEIYELRVGFQGVNYRILYFFHGREAAILAHGLVKERVVPPKDIELVVLRKRKFERHPERHTFRE